MWNIFENPCLYTNIPSMNEELNLDVCVVVVFYSNFNFLKATVRVELIVEIKKSKINKNQKLPGDKITIIKLVPVYSLGPSIYSMF